MLNIIPSGKAIIDGTDIKLTTGTTTYNQAGITYNQVSTQYEGSYLFVDITPNLTDENASTG